MEVQNKQHPSHDEEQVVVIMVPFPCQSHLNQLLELSCLISSYNIPVHYACWGTHIHQVKQRFNGTRNNIDDVNANIIHFHEFPTPPNLSPSPLKSSFHLRQPVASLLQKISRTTRRVIIIHDVVMAYVIQDGATLPNVEAFAFNPISAIISFFDGWKVMGKPFQKRQEVPEGLPSMQDSGVTAPELVNLSSLHSDFRSGSIINSCRSIEGPYIDLLEKEHIAADQKQWAIGPLNLYDSINSKGQHKCLEWLDKQAPNSVLYVSFGSTTSMTDEQIKELAIGLEQSEQKFIWVFRHADEGSIFSEDVKRGELPEGYEERMKEVGMVVRDWAPQLQILGHPSTGGFMSHCGWNSCMESISMGVPIATWPMNFDQPINAFLATNILKVGIPVNQWAQQKELVSSSTIAKAIKTLMASKEGEEMRKKAEELGGATRLSVKEGGVSRMDLDSFIAHISRETTHGETDQMVVIMVPFPWQSHLNQLLELSCLISSYNIPVHYACWGTHIHQVKQRFNGTRNNIDDVNANIIHFHEFPTPPNHSPSPLKSSFHLRQPAASLLQKISRTTRRVIIIHDVVMAYVIQDGATLPNVEAFAFNPVRGRNILCFPYSLYSEFLLTASTWQHRKVSCPAVVCRIDPPTIKSVHLKKKTVRERVLFLGKKLHTSNVRPPPYFKAGHAASRLCAHYLCCPSQDR
ncbi:unnamed protein product [Camellia sinensis]